MQREKNPYQHLGKGDAREIDEEIKKLVEKKVSTFVCLVAMTGQVCQFSLGT